MIKDIDQTHKFTCCFLTAGDAGVIVSRRIIQGIHSGRKNMFDGAVIITMVIVRSSQYIIKIKDGHIRPSIVVVSQPVIH